MRRVSVLAAGLVTAMLIGPAARAEAGVITFASRAAFNAMFPGAVLEDFEEANVADGSFGLMTGPLDSATNNALFSPGEIVNGLRVDVPGADNMFLSSNGFANYVSKAVSFNLASTPQPQIVVSFYNNDVYGFGMDLTSNPDGNTIRLTLFSGATNLGSFSVPNVLGSGTFFGAFSDDPSQPITRIELADGTYFGVDNIALGQTAVPEPATLTLIGFGALGLSRRLRSRMRR